MNTSASFFTRNASALWTLAFLVPAVALVCWLLRGVRPDVFLATLYDSALPFAFRLPMVALCICGLAAWALWRLRENATAPDSACVRSPRRVVGIALLGLALILSVGFGSAALWTVASILTGVALLEAACGVGLVVLFLPPLNLGDRFHGRAVEQYVLSTALGLGLFAFAIFVVGSAGAIHRVGWLIALVALLALTASPRAHLGLALENAFLTCVRRAHPLALGALFFTFAWFALKTALITAAPLEYDVLEYHLAAPLQYLRDGRVHFLSENVYAAMPSSAEMLFLFPLALFEDPYRGLMGARVILWGTWVLSALSVHALTARLIDGSRDEPDTPKTVPILAAALFAVVPMGAHLAADFYVEHVQTLLHATAVLAACAFLQDRRLGVRQRSGWLLLSGLLAGACCATKYSALLFTLGPLLVFVPLLCALNGSFFEGLRAAATLSLPAGFLFAPWALRNWIAGGDPLYPLGLVLQRRAREAQALPDHLDHLEVALRTGERSFDALKATVGKLWPSFSAPREDGSGGGVGRWVTEGQAGPHLLAGLPAGLIGIATPEALFVALMLIANVAIWFLYSHRVDRFLFPAFPLFAVVCGLGLARVWEIRPARKLGIAFVFVSLLTFAPLGMLYSYSLSRPQVLLGEAKPLEAMLDYYELTGNRPWSEAWRTVNRLPTDARVLFVGDAQTAYVSRPVAYNVVFNSPLLEETLGIAGKAEDALLLLKTQGITHLYLNYAEWLRLDSSYALTRAAFGNEWEYARIQGAEKSVLWAALTARQFSLYGKAWPPEVKPAYLKLTAKQYALLEELVRDHTKPVRMLRGSGGHIVCEVRALN